MFTKTTKRVISLILCVLMFVPFMTIMSSAYVADPYSDERTEARNKFGAIVEAGEVERKVLLGPTKTYHTEYRVYSPVKKATDTKYPVVFLIGKQTTEDSNADDLRLDSFAFWANDEYQNRFYETKGAYIVYVRPADADVSIQLESFKLMMEEFIKDRKANIDMNRLYVVAWDKGCSLAIKATTSKESNFAALVLSSPREMINSFPSIPTWLIASKNDQAASFDLTQCWSYLKDYTSTDLDKIRFTSFDSFNSLGEKNHETWEYVAYDIDKYTGEQSGVKTVNGRDQGVNATSVIEWMSKFGTDFGSDCDCPCHGATGWEAVKWFFKWMISMMLKIEKNRPCKCGVKDHW